MRAATLLPFRIPPPRLVFASSMPCDREELAQTKQNISGFPNLQPGCYWCEPPEVLQGALFFLGGGSCDHIHHPLSRPVACCSAECVFLSYSGSTDDSTFAGKGSLPSAAVLHSPFGEARSPFQHLTMNVNSNPRWQGMVPTASGCRVVCECLMSW